MKIQMDGPITDVALEPKDKVKPCPFCGCNSPELTHAHAASYWVECPKCGAEVHGSSGESLIGQGKGDAAHLAAARDALKRWNRRV